VTTVESFVTSTTCPSALPVVTHGAALAGTWAAYGVQVARVTAPLAAAVQGTGMPITMRNRTAAATSKATALLPISDVVVFDGLAGIRSWSPPV
jgi:hypothetical protein